MAAGEGSQPRVGAHGVERPPEHRAVGGAGVQRTCETACRHQAATAGSRGDQVEEVEAACSHDRERCPVPRRGALREGEVNRVDLRLVAGEADRRHSVERCEMREAAVGADEHACAGDDGRLGAEVACGGDTRQRTRHARMVGRLRVEVLVHDHSGVEQNDGSLLREPLDDPVDERPVRRRVGERVAEVEANGGEVVGEGARDLLRVRSAPLAVNCPVEEVAQRQRSLPDVPEQPVEELRMDERAVSPGLADRQIEHLLVPRPDDDLLLEAAGRLPQLQRRPAELLRADRVEDVDVAAAEPLVPRCHAATRDHGHVLRIESVALEEPVEERNPVEHLEPDLAEPGPDHRPAVRGGERRGRLAEQPLELAGHRGMDELRMIGGHRRGSAAGVERLRGARHAAAPACAHRQHELAGPAGGAEQRRDRSHRARDRVERRPERDGGPGGAWPRRGPEPFRAPRRPPRGAGQPPGRVRGDGRSARRSSSPAVRPRPPARGPARAARRARRDRVPRAGAHRSPSAGTGSGACPPASRRSPRRGR